MRQHYQIFLLTQIAMMIVFFSSVLPPAQAEESEQVKSCLQCELELKNQLKVHLDFYNEMLVNRYAPNLVDQWQAVRTERDLLQKKMKESMQRGKMPQIKVKDEEWDQRHQELQEKFKKAVEKRDEEQIRELLPSIIDHDEKLNKLNKQRLKMVTIS